MASPLLQTLRLRLTNLHQGNRALRLLRLSPRIGLDFRDLGFIDEDSPEQLLARIIAGKDCAILPKLDARHEKTNLLDKKLQTLYREIQLRAEELGAEDTYIGYPFCEGKLIDGTTVRCPVLLFPVRVIRSLTDIPRWKIELRRDEAIQFNQTLFLAYQFYQQVRLPADFWEAEVPYNPNWGVWLADLYAQIKHFGIEINFNSGLFDQKLLPFFDMAADTAANLPIGVLSFQSQAVLGIFPQSDSALADDYDTLSQWTQEIPLLQLHAPTTHEPIAPLRRRDTYHIAAVDETQEAALSAIAAGQSLVVHGPPGTGKSQVIVNSIAQALAQGKRVLVVSQKRAALDVVYNRLSEAGLGAFSMLVHDYKNDRSNVFEKIKNSIESIDVYKKDIANFDITQVELSHRRACAESDRQSRFFTELYDALTAQQPCGMTAHALYEALAMSPQNSFSIPVEMESIRTIEDLYEINNYIKTIFEYLFLLQETHTWRERISFAQLQPADNTRYAAFLASLSAQVEQLRALFSASPQPISVSVIENIALLNQVERIDSIIQNISLLTGIEDIYRTKLTEKKAQKGFALIEKYIYFIEKSEFLTTIPLSELDAVGAAAKLYLAQKNSVFSLFNSDFRAAKTLLKQYFPQKISSDMLLRLIAEYTAAQVHQASIQDFYSKNIFFSDYLATSPLPFQQDWLQTKRQQWAAYETLQAQQPPLSALQPVFGANGFVAERWEESRKAAATLRAFVDAYAQQLPQWQAFLSEPQIQALSAAIRGESTAATLVERLQTEFSRDFLDMCALDKVRAAMPSAWWEIAIACVANSTSATAAQQYICYATWTHWIGRIEQQLPVLQEVSTRGFTQTRINFSKNLQQIRRNAATILLRRVKERVVDAQTYNRLGNAITYRKILHEVSKKRMRWTLRRLVAETWNEGLATLAPVWLASPETAAALFPMQPDVFDCVIFDEASQGYVERALPVLLRGKQVIIAGDDKQLPPYTLYTVRYDDAEQHFSQGEAALEVESILDLAKLSLPEMMLRWHYRSQYPALIAYSNQAFYGGKLQVFPPSQPPQMPVLQWVSVEGVWQNQQNRAEAERVVALILDNIRQYPQQTIGVITFNYPQQMLIQDCLDAEMEALRSRDAELYARLEQALIRAENEVFEGIFIKNIENVQGDERDCIIFSVGYAPDARGVLRAQFGSLSQRGGENRLNVAITRAKQRVIVVCSFLPHQLDVSGAEHAGAKHFQAYLNSVFQQSQQVQIPDNEAVMASPLVEKVAAALAEAGFTVRKNVGTTAYKIPLTASKNGFHIAIEIEGAAYFSGESAASREVYRPALLAERGWVFHRVWLRNLWLNFEGEIARIIAISASAKGD